jgi:hypothetical protein
MNKYYEEVKIFYSMNIKADLAKHISYIDYNYTYSNYPEPFTIYKKGEENNHQDYEIATGDWLVNHGAEYGEYVLID